MYKITSFFKYKISFFIFLLSYLMIPNVGFSAAAAAAEDRVFDSVLETPSRKIRIISEISGKRVYEDVLYTKKNPIRFILGESWPDYELSFDKYFFRGKMGHSRHGPHHPHGEEHPIGTIYYNEEIGVVVSFCGSKPGLSLPQMLDDSTWLTNSEFDLNDAEHYFRGSRGKIHKGFALVARDFRDQLKEALSALLTAHPEARDKSFYVTGHSLGGALSKFGALSLIRTGGELAERLHFGENQLKVVSFSSPRIGNRDFYEFFEKTISRNNILEFICQGDIVPRLPSGILTPPDYEFGTLPPGHFIPIYITALFIEKHREDWEEKGFWEKAGFISDIATTDYRFIIKPSDVFSKLHSVVPRLIEENYKSYKQRKRLGSLNDFLEKLGLRPWGDE